VKILSRMFSMNFFQFDLSIARKRHTLQLRDILHLGQKIHFNNQFTGIGKQTVIPNLETLILIHSIITTGMMCDGSRKER
jgi:hypothetical protein